MKNNLCKKITMAEVLFDNVDDVIELRLYLIFTGG